MEGDKITRLRRNCPKCGDGVFLAEHKDRLSCGACGYTEFKGNKPPAPKQEQSEKQEPAPAEPSTSSQESSAVEPTDQKTE